MTKSSFMDRHRRHSESQAQTQQHYGGYSWGAISAEIGPPMFPQRQRATSMSITNPSRDPPSSSSSSSSSQERKSLLTSMLGLGGMGGSAKVTRDDMSSTMLKNSSFADLSFVGGEEESHDHWRDKWTQERRSSNEFKEAQQMAQDVVRQANNPVKLLSSSPAGDSPLTGSLLSGSLPGRHSTGGTRNHAGYSSYPYGPE